jgi:Mn-dependent DtxR family transcriptional regulator
MTVESLTEFERALLRTLQDRDGCPPATLAVALDTDLPTVYETTAELRERGLVRRAGFDTCRLTDRGHDLLAEADPPE